MTNPWRRGPSLVVLFALALAPPAVAVEAAKSPVPAAPPSPAASPPRAAVGETAALVVNDAGAQTAMGLPVQTSKSEDLGHVVDLVVDRNGSLLAAIVDFGGFLGVGSRKIAVDWRILHLPKTGPLNKLIADLSMDQLRAAPAFKPGEAIVIMGGSPAPTAARATPSAALSSPTPKP
jgi:hypothetical protein